MIVIKKSTILCITTVVVLAVIFGCFVGLNLTSKVSYNPLTIVIDAGHGGVDGGVTGVRTKVKESDLNLAISKKISKSLTDKNFNVVLTRKTADGLYGIYSQGFKKRDMQKRKEIITSSGASLVVSIHQNTFKDSSRRGVQIFYSENGNNNTKLFADFMQNYLNNKINIPLNSRGYLAQKGDFYIVKCSSIPTIIIECGFLSNAEDEKMLTSESYQEKISTIIASGVSEFYSKLAEENFNNEK